MRCEYSINGHTFQCSRKIKSLRYQIVNALENHKSSMTFVDMPHSRFDAKRLECTHTADTQNNLLFNPHGSVTPIQVVRDIAVLWRIFR